jgi:hypothetical protein
MRKLRIQLLSLLGAAIALGAFGLMFLPKVAAQPAGRLQVRGVALAHAFRGNGYGSESCRKQLAAIAGLGGNWVSLTDFAFMPGVDQPTVSFGRSGEKDGLADCIRDAHTAGLKVLIKPHLWSRDFGGNKKWHGDIAMTNEADWATWFDQYSGYVLQQAKLAAEHKAEALSVGCELEGTSVVQEQRWRALVAEVRKVYGGYVIYSAAFAEWQKVPWWDAVDCIGIDAYMPLTDVENASEEQLRAGWARLYEQEIGPFQKRWNKPICFTEMGYTASMTAAARPWAYDVDRPSTAYQARLYKVALEEAAKRDYVRGVFLWKWFTADPGGRGRGEPFTIQDRPEVLEAIKSGFK